MIYRRTLLWFSFLMIIILSACNLQAFPTESSLVEPKRSQPTEQEPVSTEATPNLPQAYIEFRTMVPEDTPTDDEIYLSIVDEVSGLYLNSTSYPMTLDLSTGIYATRLLFPLGSIVKYRYEKQGDELRVAEHSSDGQPVRYRMLQVNGPSSVDDIVSRWTDSSFDYPSGRIMGTASDAETGQPIPNLLIAVGGMQTFTRSDGTFLIEGLPEGVHNLVGYSMNGEYQTFQQGAEIAPESTTPALMLLKRAPQVTISFLVTPPSNTPPLIPLRFAGNLYQLGNTFGTLSGGVSTIASRMPALTALPDGRYQIDLQLPVGGDIRYKYTLGDGFWNAERKTTGELRLRQLIVPAQDTVIEEKIETWETNPGANITFDITVPDNTPPDDFISIQFNPIFGWTEPMPMWSLGGNRWAYVLYSPLNLPGNLSYRYCRNNQCGTADDAATPGQYGAGRTVSLSQLPLQVKEVVEAWTYLDQIVDPSMIFANQLNPFPTDFMRGIEFVNAYHPSWQQLIPSSVARLEQLGANWLSYTPTYSVTRGNPPVFEPVAGKDALWPDHVDTIQQAHAQGLSVIINPVLIFPDATLEECLADTCPNSIDQWWSETQRDYSWWIVWFDHYREFLLNFADLAALTGSEGLVLGGDWIGPSLPQGILWDGQPSNVPADAEQRWRDLIAEIRSRYPGKIIWSMPLQSEISTPPFLDAIDQVYIQFQTEHIVASNPEIGFSNLQVAVPAFLDDRIAQIHTQIDKPIIIGLEVPSEQSLEYQQYWYDSMLQAINQTNWISGFVSKGYYFPAILQDPGSSVHGKPAEVILQQWFTGQMPVTP